MAAHTQTDAPFTGLASPRRMLNEGFAADSTLEALLSLPPTDPLAPVQKSFADANRQGWRWAHVPRLQQ